MEKQIKYKPVIGLEVHVEQSTASKMFCECPAEHFGVKANTHTCPVCLGLPGALPVANRAAINNTILFGKAFDCEIALFSKFDRKHYFYPDLPKGYQISQYDLPLCNNGKFLIKLDGGESKTFRIKRIHLEEDTGKLVHTELNGERVSLVDFNRSGVPLMEMVTEPDFESASEVDSFLRELQLVVRYLGISTADMEKGSMRLEANISMRKDSEKTLPDYKVELKNINSFKYLKRAIEIETDRQSALLLDGKKVVQETRGYDETQDKTFSQRTKEDAQDYRYFPEPDIPPLSFSLDEVNKIFSRMPEMPRDKRAKYVTLGLSEHYIETLVADKARALYFEKALDAASDNVSNSAKLIAGAMVNQNMDVNYPEPELLVKKLIETLKTDYATTEETKAAVEIATTSNPKAVEDYKNGNTNVVGFLIGQVQKELKGKGDIQLVRGLLKDKLEQ